MRKDQQESLEFALQLASVAEEKIMPVGYRGSWRSQRPVDIATTAFTSVEVDDIDVNLAHYLKKSSYTSSNANIPGTAFSRPIHRPSVKSGTGTGMLPIAMDCSLRQVTDIHVAVS